MSIESQPSMPIERESHGGLESRVAEMSEKLRAAGIPVGPDLRLKMTNPEDIARANAIKKGFRDSGGGGDDSELLIVYILNKYLGEDFVVVRSAVIDDQENHADIIILDKKTKQTVCAIDGTEAIRTTLDLKRERIERRNINKGGAELKYCLTLDKDEQFIIKKAKKVPLMLVSLPKQMVEDFIRAIDAPGSDTVRLERETFNLLLVSLYDGLIDMESRVQESLEDLKKNTRRRHHKSPLPPEVGQRENFIRKIQAFRQSLEPKLPHDYLEKLKKSVT